MGEHWKPAQPIAIPGSGSQAQGEAQGKQRGRLRLAEGAGLIARAEPGGRELSGIVVGHLRAGTARGGGAMLICK